MTHQAKKIVINCCIIAAILGVGAWVLSLFVHLGNVEYTNNAQVKQDLVAVNCRVQGFVQKIYVGEFQQVHKGDTLAVIEDTEFRLRVKQAEAALETARHGKAATQKGVSGASNQISVTEAGIAEVKVLLKNAETDYNRYKKLYEQGAVTRQQFEGVETQYESLKAKVETLTRQKAGAGIGREETTIRVDQQSAGIEAAEAAVELAKLNLSYTVILAPCDGYTSRKLIQEGELMQPGKLAFSIVNTEEVWVLANFKESQMQHIDMGSKATMTIDAIPGATFTGQVIAISDATGAQYSATPTDNSAGNFIKVEGRIPVKISIQTANPQEALKKLRSGLNVELEILY